MAITSMGSYSGVSNNNNNNNINGMETSSSDLVAMLHGPCSNVGQLQVAAPALLVGGLEDAVATGQKRPYSSYCDGPSVEDGPGELDGDEGGGSDELSPVEKKRRLTFEQVRSLERNFEMENKLEPERKMQLAKELGLRPRQVAVWFQNRRARWKTKQLERDYETLAADYERLKADYEQVLGEKKQLKAEVQRLSSDVDPVGNKTLDPPGRSRESEILSRHHNARSSPTVDVSLAHHRFKDDVTASGSNSDVLDADSPRTTDSSSCGGGGGRHLIDASHSPDSFLGEDPAILQPLEGVTMSKLEDHGPASDGFHDEFVDQSCNYLLLQLDEQSVLPWWDWP